MQTVNTLFEDNNGQLFAEVSDGKRYAFFSFDESTLSKPWEKYSEDDTKLKQEIMVQLDQNGFCVSTLPHIEDTTPAMQDALNWLFDSENTELCIFDRDPENSPWAELGLDQKEYENQIDSDVEKFRLGDCVEKNSGQLLYFFQGEVLGKFSKAASEA